MGEKGRILVFTGTGKGKTTRALGWGLRAGSERFECLHGPISEGA